MKHCKKSCKTCKDTIFQNFFKSTITGREYSTINPTNQFLNCSSKNVIYLITCSQCGVQYVGQTSTKLNKRMSSHRSAIKDKEYLLIGEHFNGGGRCSLDHLKVQPIEQIIKNSIKFRLERENFWIKELRTLTPYGLNDKLENKNWRFRTRNDIAGICFNKLVIKRGCRGQKRKKLQAKIETKADNIMKVLMSKYDNFENWRLTARAMINTVKLNKLYECSWIFVDYSLDSQCNVPREMIDLLLDMINHRLYLHRKSLNKSKPRDLFLKIYFQGKDIEKLNLNKILNKNLKIFPKELNFSSSPTIIFERSKTIGSMIFNYKKTVENVITNNYQPDSLNFPSCTCTSSVFNDPNHGHIVTNDLGVIECNELRSLLSKGPKYREPQNVNWDHFLTHFKTNFKVTLQNWVSKINKDEIDLKFFEPYFNKVLKDIKTSIEKIKKRKRFYRRMRLSTPKIKDLLSKLHEKFVFIPTDKAGNNIAVVCKVFYITQSLKELGIFIDGSVSADEDRTYIEINVPIKRIINRHVKYVYSKLKCDSIPEKLPYLYWIAKMHKKPITKQRFIAASGLCTTKPISKMLTKILKRVDIQIRMICRRFFHRYGINPYWILKNSTEVFECVAQFNIKSDCKNIRTYDFATLYTKIPHKLLKKTFTWIINLAFKDSKKNFLSVYRLSANWTRFPSKHNISFNKYQLIRILHWLVDNIYVTFGDKIFKQVIGIPMGTDCAPYLANLFLFAHEYKWILKQVERNRFYLLNKFKGCCRYIDDLLLINNDETMKRVMHQMYPKELKLVPDDSNGITTHFLDLTLKIENNILSSYIYDKRDVFNFSVVNFPFLNGNIPGKSSYGVFIGELVRYARACTYIDDFKSKVNILISKLKKQFFKPKMLKKSWFKFCKKHFLLIQKYGSSILSFYNEWI